MNKPITSNFDDRPNGINIDMLVMHYTGMRSATEALDQMCDPVKKVSAHYMIYEDGAIISLVPEEKRAWHAGISCWQGISSLNDSSIGIEIVNPGHEFGYVQFPDAQMEAVLQISKHIIERYNIEARNVVGHSDIAPLRKQDPGELFNWKWLAKNGVGLWPNINTIWRSREQLIEPGTDSTDVARVQKMLADYGYHIRVDGHYGEKTEQIIKAFKRHFVPESVNIVWDRLSDKRMLKLLEMIAK